MSIPATIGQDVTLAMVLENGETSLYPQAEVYDGASLEATVDLADMGKGRYEGAWGPTAVGTYSVIFNVYQDAGHSVELTPLVYTREIEQVFVTQSDVDDLAVSLSRLLGLSHENAFIDNCVYDTNSMLISARVRIFDSKANVPTVGGGDETTGLLSTYNISSEYGAPGRMSQYRMVKE
jgi:hypothetical protein